MRLEETAAARAATRSSIVDGIPWIQRILSSHNQDARQSESGETLKAVQRICQKCERDGRPHKFPVPENCYHALIVDFRTFLNGGDEQDRIHVGLWGAFVASHWFRRYWDRRLITGVFDPETNVAGAREVRERVHFLGFVNERRHYVDGGFAEATQFIANPGMFLNAEAMRNAIATWPFQPTIVLNDREPPVADRAREAPPAH